MPAFNFTLIVEGPDLQADEFVEALFEAGCDDALIGRVGGVQYIDFDRESESFKEAVLSAVNDLETIEGVDVVRIADGLAAGSLRRLLGLGIV